MGSRLSRKAPSRTGLKTNLKKSRAARIPLCFKAVDFKLQMVEMRWMMNGHVMVDYFPVYKPVQG